MASAALQLSNQARRARSAPRAPPRPCRAAGALRLRVHVCLARSAHGWRSGGWCSRRLVAATPRHAREQNAAARVRPAPLVDEPVTPLPVRRTRSVCLSAGGPARWDAEQRPSAGARMSRTSDSRPAGGTPGRPLGAPAAAPPRAPAASPGGAAARRCSCWGSRSRSAGRAGTWTPARRRRPPPRPPPRSPPSRCRGPPGHLPVNEMLKIILILFYKK